MTGVHHLLPTSCPIDSELFDMHLFILVHIDFWITLCKGWSKNNLHILKWFSQSSVCEIEVLTAVNMNMAVFCIVELCWLVEIYQHFRGPCCLCQQGGDDGGSKYLWNVSKLLPDRLHHWTTQKTAIWILATLETWNLMQIFHIKSDFLMSCYFTIRTTLHVIPLLEVSKPAFHPKLSITSQVFQFLPGGTQNVNLCYLSGLR
jgi:hypothetical protein